MIGFNFQGIAEEKFGVSLQEKKGRIKELLTEEM